MCEKSSINIVQEYFVKKNMSPHFQEIILRDGTHLNLFKFVVTCDKYTGEGTARSKKEAKRLAAEDMMTKIPDLQQFLNESSKNNVRQHLSASESSDKNSSIGSVTNEVSYINKLQEFCVINNVREPEYKVIKTCGPPHRTIFTMQCQIGNEVCQAEADTKKQAKHMVAKEMYCRLKEIPNEDLQRSEVDTAGLEFCNVSFETLTVQDYPIEKVHEKYKELSKTVQSHGHSDKTFANLHLSVKDTYTSERRNCFRTMLTEVLNFFTDDIVSKEVEGQFLSTLKIMNATPEFIEITSTEDSKAVFHIRIFIKKFNLCEIGSGDTYSMAKHVAMRKMGAMLVVLLT